MKETEKRIRLAGVILCQLLTVITVIRLLPTGDGNRLAMAFGTVLLILLPEVMERLFRCRLSLPVYLFGLVYAIGPMLGHCWDLYYAGIGWDKLLHAAGGVMFALIGLFLFDFFSKEDRSVLLSAIFALCFSMALSVLWEFVEYGCDLLFHTDMQNDTLVTSIYSYLLGDGPGVAGSLEDISTVTVDGTLLPTGGYIDIGLIDTMQDMLVETLGAAVVSTVHLIGRGKHPLITLREETV